MGFIFTFRIFFFKNYWRYPFVGLITYYCSLCCWPKCEHIEGLTKFSFQTQFLQFVWISNNKIKHQYLSQLSFENCEINSIKSNPPRAFQAHKECPQILVYFSISILSSFHWKNGSMINSFHIIVPNDFKPSRCTPTHRKLSKDIKSAPWNVVVWEISTWQTKQTTLFHT